MAFGHLHAVRQAHSTEAWLTVLAVQRQAPAQRVDFDERMVNDFRIAGLELNRFNVAVRRQWDGNNKIAIDVLAIAWQLIGYRHFDDQVRFAERPPFGERWLRRQVRSFAFLRSLGHPSPNQFEFAVAKPAFIGELPIAGFGQPRRHGTALRQFHDLLRSFLHIAIIEQRKRPGLPRSMTRSAMTEDDRRDVPVESNRGLDRRLRRLFWRSAFGGKRVRQGVQNTNNRSANRHD
jgi:hypothetical protein